MNPLDYISGVQTMRPREGSIDDMTALDLPVTLGPWECGCEIVFVEDPMRHANGDASHFKWRYRCGPHTTKTTIVFAPCDGVSIHVTPYREDPAVTDLSRGCGWSV